MSERFVLDTEQKYMSIDRQYFVWGLKIDRILSGISRRLYTNTGPDFIELTHAKMPIDHHTGRLKAIKMFNDGPEFSAIYQLDEYLSSQDNRQQLIELVGDLESGEAKNA